MKRVCNAYLDELRASSASAEFLVLAQLLSISTADLVVHGGRQHFGRSIHAVATLFAFLSLGNQSLGIRCETQGIGTIVFRRLATLSAIRRAREFQ